MAALKANVEEPILVRKVLMGDAGSLAKNPPIAVSPIVVPPRVFA
jgi:hypothetical protein